MAVLIKDFEVLEELPMAAVAPPNTQPIDDDEYLPTPEELAQLLRRDLERALRLRAY